MGTTRRIARTSGDYLKSLDDRSRDQFLEALEEAGGGPAALARILAQLAQGYRSIIGPDAQQMKDVLEGKQPKRFMPQVITLEDGREVIRVDNMTQMKALKILMDAHGITSSGFSVNVQQGVAMTQEAPKQDAPAAVRLGELLTSGEREPAIAEIRDATADLPPEKRRALIEALLVPAKSTPIDVAGESNVA